MSKGWIYIIIYLSGVLISSFAQVLLKKSANRKYANRIQEYLNPLVIIAYTIFFGATFFSLYAYKGIPLSLGPVLEASSYIFVAILGVVFLKEKINKKKLLGLGFIVLGIVIFSIG